MDYNFILDNIRPTKEENDAVNAIYSKLSNFIDECCLKENINAKTTLVGSLAKGTYLRGKSDIDIFISFPLGTDEEYLKKTGLYLGHKCNDYFNGVAIEHYASHPYVTCAIDGYEVDFVPCYEIDDGSQLKTAVDRTILHTKFVKNNLSESQKDEVLLLKRFMDMTGTYGSEFKVGGFAGYLCELLIIKYGTFEECLKKASIWKFGHVIDLKNYNTSNLFNDPLIVIDPTDMNRNVGAALRLDKMAEFIQSARNYLASDNKKDYFYPYVKNISKQSVLDEFKSRNSQIIAIKFEIPEIPLDTLHPQLKKTTDSLAEKLNREEFLVFKADYFTDEKTYAILIFEMLVSQLNNVKIHYGPKIFYKKACENFIKKYGVDKCYTKDDFLVLNIEREFKTAIGFIDYVFTKNHISLIKVGKNLTKSIVETYEIMNLEELNFDLKFLIFLDEFLNPNQKIMRS